VTYWKETEEICKKIAQQANTCCYRSDGYEQHLALYANALVENLVRKIREESRKEALNDAISMLRKYGTFTDVGNDLLDEMSGIKK
jgi:hypothetical protein